MNCWAKSLGDCSVVQSREHYISSAVLGSESIVVKGLPWCRDEFKTISVASFARNMLCTHHNSQLSPVDLEAGKLFEALTEFRETFRSRLRFGVKRRGLKLYKLNGLLLERWFLKTAINLAYGRPIEEDVPWSPPREWVALAYGIKPFPDRTGFYLPAEVGQVRKIERRGVSRIAMRFLSRGAGLVGAQFKLHEFEFAVSMIPLAESSNYRPKWIKEAGVLRARQVIRFSWLT